MKEQKPRPLMGTLFSNKISKQGTLHSLKDWIHAIQTGRWEREVTEARLLVSHNRHDQAKAIKGDLPMFVCSAECIHGRLHEHITQFSHVLMLDYDRHDPEWSNMMVEQTKEIPNIIGAYATIGYGLRLFVNVGQLTPDEWKTAYTLTADYMDDYLHAECDRSCSDILRGTFPSYDPNAWYRNIEDTEVIPYISLFQQLRQPQPQPSQLSPMLNQPTGTQQTSVDTIIDRFFQRYSFQKGERHSRLVFLGQYAKWHHLPATELDTLVYRASSHCAQSDMPLKEFRSAISWGYHHSQEGPDIHSAHPPCPHAPGSTRSARSTMPPMDIQQPSAHIGTQPLIEEEEEEIDENTIVNETCPVFPDEIYANLPLFLRRALAIKRSPRERDMLFVAILANLSGCLPYIRTIYRRRKYSPHFYFAAVAPAGAGKGVISLACRLPEKINDQYLADYEHKKKAYKKACTIWDLEQRLALKEKREPNWDLEPVEPKRQLLMIPPETSKSQIIFDLEASHEIGMILSATEISLLTEALRSDYGKYTSLIRVCFHHETLSKNYKVDGRMVVVKRPRLAICMSGTLQQLFELVHNIEDGTYSRLSLLTAPAIDHWIGEEELQANEEDDTIFDQLSSEVKNIFDFFNRGQEIIIRTTPEQRRQHETLFGQLFDHVSIDGENGFQAILGRHGLIAMRIAAILSALRIYESGFYFNDYCCSQEDFDTALQITQILLQHSLQLSTILDNRNHRNALRRFNNAKRVLESLSNTFIYSEFIDMAAQYKISRSSAKRSLKRLLNKGMLIKSDGVYHKVRQR